MTPEGFLCCVTNEDKTKLSGEMTVTDKDNIREAIKKKKEESRQWIPHDWVDRDEALMWRRNTIKLDQPLLDTLNKLSISHKLVKKE